MSAVAAGPGAAHATARVCGGRVEIASLTSETERVWANSDGSRSVEQAGVPVRAQQHDGSWADIDLTLHADADGSVAPRVHPGNLRISGAAAAGEHVLAASGKGSERLAMLYTGALPAPTLDGNRATYANVRPGVDLVVDATRTGFEQLFVVHDRAALAQVASITLPVVGQGIASHQLRADGVTELRNSKGKVFATVPPARMWDADTDTRTGLPKHETVVATSTAKRLGRVSWIMVCGGPGLRAAR